MIQLLTTAALGYWACGHIGFYKTEQGTHNVEIHTGDIARDIVWLWFVLLSACTFAVDTGRNTRHYCNAILIPWLAGYGVYVPLVPALMLPRSAESLIDFDALEDRITEGLPKFIA
jgi:hypothetical protein